MNIKKIIKISFSFIVLLVIFISTINLIVLYQIKDNNKSQKEISKLVSLQESMNGLSKDLINVNDIKSLKLIKKSFTNFEKQFENAKDRIIAQKNDLLDMVLIDVYKNKTINNKLISLYKNEKSIEYAFDKLYIAQNKKILWLYQFKKQYPKEKNLRKKLETMIFKTSNITLVKHFGNLKYYSKEALFQHKNAKYFDKWLSQIEFFKNKFNTNNWYKYKNLVQDIRTIILSIEKLEKEKEKLNNDILNVVELNKDLNTQIQNDVQVMSLKFINNIYIVIFVLLIITIIIIILLEYKVYRNIELSVDEIEQKVKDGTKTIEELNDEIQTTQKEVVFTMGAIGESRSKETGNHVKRVAEYSKLLALYYGLNQDDAEMLKQASPMHDIGKVAIPDSILNKPGRFDEHERKIMDTHAVLGYDMLKHSNRKLLKMAATVAYEHHEKYDGRGYPQGLKGEDIHIFGRITALADVFDALGSDRVYKKAWDDERIFKLLKEEKGKHFDPKLIDIFFDNLDDFLKIRDKFKENLDLSEISIN